MVLKRCAWHRRYFRYPWVFGVASWRGRGLLFADGICPGCATRIRRDLTLAGRAWRPDGPAPWEPPMGLPPTIVMVLATVVIILAARPLDPTPVVEPLPARRAPSALASTGPGARKADIAAAPIAEPPEQRARSGERLQGPVPPPERIVYVPGWRARGAFPELAGSRSASEVTATRRTLGLGDTRWPRAGSAVQAP